jgi:hypothetical protein
VSSHGKQPLEILVSGWLEFFLIFSSESTKTNELLLCMVDVWETFNKSFSFYADLQLIWLPIGSPCFVPLSHRPGE